jgi:hypothetical protein
MKLMLKNKRLAFPALAKPQAIGDGEPAYGARLIIDPDDKDVKVIDDAMREVAVRQWKDKGPDILAMLIEDKKVAFSKLPYKSTKTGKVYDGFEGKYSLGTRNPKTRPTAVDAYGTEITDTAQIERIIYAGCRVHAQVEIWAQDNNFGRRVNCSLLGVMFAGDGDSFGGGSAPASADEFADMAKKPEEALDKSGAGGDYV